ncbi:MAG: hypothetical protein K2O80_02230 [Helicobacter apodemus]|nr:hypothetical protein [Helicobacter apodemus]
MNNFLNPQNKQDFFRDSVTIRGHLYPSSKTPLITKNPPQTQNSLKMALDS